jgi:chemotaxis protein methyltransferase CheR
MSHTLSEAVLESLSRLMAERLGLSFPPLRWPDLTRGIDSVARELGFQDSNQCARWLLSTRLSDRGLEVLARHFTVGETYFLRDRETFTSLAEQILPEIIGARQFGERRLRIWSAGCATGEEPYSIAILLQQAIPDIEKWNLTILGTDVNPAFLQRAAQGIYTEWSFRGQHAELRARYFTAVANGRYQILPQLQRMVSFALLNLAEDSYPALWSGTYAMDVIFCRNVLMYFTPAQAQKAVRNLHRSLVDGGWLIVGASEASQTLFDGFMAVRMPWATFYRKAIPSPITRIPVAELAGQPATLQPDHFLPPNLSNEPGEPTEAASGEVVASEALTARDFPSAIQEATRTPFVSPVEVPCPEATSALKNAADLLSPARHCANQGRLAEALALCEQALAADKLNPASHYLHASILLECGASREAAKFLRKALYLDPRFVLAHVALGTQARREGKAQEATKHFENALALLSTYRPEEIVPEAEGMTAARMQEILRATLHCEVTS